MKLFSIEGLAEHEGVTYDYLRSVVVKYRAGKLPDGWRGYKFFGVDGKCWFAYPGTEIVEVFYGSGRNKQGEKVNVEISSSGAPTESEVSTS